MILYYFLFLVRVYLHCVSTNLWNFYTNNKLFIPLQYTTWLKISKDTLPPPHLVHVSGKGYFYMSSHGTRYSGITQMQNLVRVCFSCCRSLLEFPIFHNNWYIFEVTLRILRPSVVHQKVRLMILCILLLMECTQSLTNLNFRCAFKFSNPFLRDRLFCVVPKGTLSVSRKE